MQPAQRSTAAASAEPPPSPAPAGMRFTMRTAALRPTTSRAPRHQVVGPGGHVVDPEPSAHLVYDRDPRTRFEREGVGKVDR